MQMENISIHGTGHFGFSGVTPGDLPNDEYTLVVLADDVSPSTAHLRDDSCKVKQQIIQSCRKSPRSENLLLRLTHFGSKIKETHGYKPLSEIDENQYVPEKTIGHSTKLYDATFDAVSSVLEYSTRLYEQNDITSNAIVFVITDGMDIDSAMGPDSIKKLLKDSRIGEKIESIIVVLIGIFTTADAQQIDVYLQDFKKEAGLDQYVSAGDATPQKLAKLANFVSQSISSQSQALGSGGPSQLLTF